MYSIGLQVLFRIKQYSRDSSVTVTVRLWAGQPCNLGSTLGKKKGCSLARIVQTDFGAHPVSSPVSIGTFAQRVKRLGRGADY